MQCLLAYMVGVTEFEPAFSPIQKETVAISVTLRNMVRMVGFEPTISSPQTRWETGLPYTLNKSISIFFYKSYNFTLISRVCILVMCRTHWDQITWLIIIMIFIVMMSGYNLSFPIPTPTS